MKKKIFLMLTMIAIFALVLAFGVSAATYNYYENEIKDGNLLYNAETMVAKDFKNGGQQTRYEAIRAVDEKLPGFAKYDASGKPLTWYVVSETVLYDDAGKYIGKNIVVKSTLTDGGAGTIDVNGLYTFGSGTVEGLTAGQVVSANFFGLEIKSFVENAFMATVSDADRKIVGTFYTGTWGKEYACVAAQGSYLNFLYLPKTLETISNRFCYRSPLRVLEFEDNIIACDTIPQEAFSFCASLKTLIIPEGIEEIIPFEKRGDFEYGAFRECLSLEFVKFPDSLTEISDNAFYRCVSIHTVIYGENATYIGRLSNSYGRFGFGDKKENNVNMKYIYVPNLYANNIESGIAEEDMAKSLFDQYRGADGMENYVGKTNNIVFFFDGSLEDAKKVGDFCALQSGEQHYRIALGDVTHNTLKKACDPVDYATYILNKEKYDNLTGYLVVYNGDYCDECHGEGRYTETLEYLDGFMKPGRRGHVCVSCGYITKIAGEIEPLFVSVGYSKSEVNYDAIMVGFNVNLEAINEYMEIEGYEIAYGLFAAKSAKLGNNTIFDENGNVNAGALAVEMSQRNNYSVIELKVTGIDTYSKRGEALIMGGYVKVNKGESEVLEYLQAAEANEGEIYSTVKLLDYLTPEQAGAVIVDQKEESVDFVIEADAIFG